MFTLPDSWLWDFWLAKDHGTYHLFFLHASRSLHDPDRRHMRAGIGHAISTDLVTWEQVSDALVHGDIGSFDQTATWTGSVVKGPDDRWYLFYTGAGPIKEDGAHAQQIGLATSNDLMTWNKYPGSPVASADPRWYETIGGPAPWQDEHWRDPWVFPDPDGQGWHMLITARATTGSLDDRGVVGHARSADLLHWDVQPPLSEPGAGFGHLEVFQVAQVDGRDVLLFNCAAQQLAPARRATGVTGGIWTAPAASPLGPYDLTAARQIAQDPSLYVGKLVQDPAGTWVLLAFHDINKNGDFVGALSDPIPVHWNGDTLTITHTDNLAPTG